MNNIKLERHRMSVLGVPIDKLSWESALETIHSWVTAGQSRYVCICNAHSVVTAANDARFFQVIAQADMATPDGAPVAWMMRRLGERDQRRINGPDLMQMYCAAAAQRSEAIYLYGSTPKTLETLERVLSDKFPGLVIAGRRSPPFRPLSAEEDQADVDDINRSGAGTVWVSLGCPKQELYLHWLHYLPRRLQ